MSDPLKEAWAKEPVKNRRAIAQALEQGKPQRTHRGAVLAIWLGSRQMRRGPKVAGFSFVVLALVFIGLRVYVEGLTVTQALLVPDVYIIAGLAALLQLWLFNRQVRRRYHDGMVASVAKLEGKSAKADLDVAAALRKARDRKWVMDHWDRISK